VQLDLSDKPSFACVALVCEATGETLHEKIFREGVSWREPDVVVEAVEPEIEQLLLTGESETVELREKLDKGRPERLAKTAAAFANTKGGTIVFGVDDDHHVVGCQTQGMADTITNILRSYCDPPPAFTTRVVNHENKELLLVQIVESASAVHTVKDLGPFIRANGTNRSPNSHELALLWQRRNVTGMGLSRLF
jgi:ATP-dependent DNA helicase RecG